MLSLKNLAKLADIEQKTAFPYKILDTKKIKEIINVNIKMFENKEEYDKFLKENNKKINIYDVLEKYCKNDALITKKSINKY
jgi:hypothetical protein